MIRIKYFLFLFLFFNGEIFADTIKPINNLQSIDIEITSYLGKGQTFERGDRLKFFVNLSRDAYLYVWYQTVDNKLFQLIPNNSLDNNFFKAGMFISVPSDKAKFEFIVSEPFGAEKVLAVAIDKPIILDGKPLNNSLKLMSLSIDKIKENLRSHATIFYGEAHFNLLTREVRKK